MERIDRREFCKGAAGLAGIIAAGYGPSLYAAGANEKIRVACVGYSDRFHQTLLPCFLHHSKELGFDMVAVADLWKKRLDEHAKPAIEKAIYKADVGLPLRKSHLNPAIKKLYADFLGEPGSHLAHELLHTSYTKRDND